MKKIVSIIFILIIFTNCKAQILDISDYAGVETVTGTYYKDTQNVLNAFVGTYIYTNGNTSLKIVLQKKIMSVAANGRYKEDLIIGEYQFIKNGVEKINTLDQLVTGNYADGRRYSIHGSSVLTGQELGCDDCTPTEKRLRLGLIDNTINNFAELIVRKVVVNGQPALKIRLSWNGRSRPEGTTLPQPALPDGDYTLIKQP